MDLTLSPRLSQSLEFGVLSNPLSLRPQTQLELKTKVLTLSLRRSPFLTLGPERSPFFFKQTPGVYHIEYVILSIFIVTSFGYLQVFIALKSIHK